MDKKYNSYFFFKNQNKSQAKCFLLAMDKNIFYKTIQEMQLLATYGIEPKYVSIKKFQNNIWKIRTKDHSNNVRLFFYLIDHNIYYLYGFMKKTQKTPEGKKITINNLKIDLLNVIKAKNNEKFFELIDFNKLSTLK